MRKPAITLAILLSALAVPLAPGVQAGAQASHSRVSYDSASDSSRPQATAQSRGVLLVCNGSTLPCPRTAPAAGPYYRTIQGAVDAARPGDWILIYPGVYHEKSSRWPTAGVWVDKADLHLRGWARNQVIVDGSNGTAAHPCPSAAAEQDFTPRDGIVVWKASGVTIQNLTVCDYLSGASGHGNEIWWDGGHGSGRIGLGSFSGSYLTATSQYAPANLPGRHLAQYGIFAGNSRGPGLITHSYAGNMADGAFYVGACRRVCNTTLADDTGVNSALGYTGTNSGGRLVITNSAFVLNHAGLAPNSENNDDAPPPQDGRCPGSVTRSCTIIEHNLVEANNNANAPSSASTAPVGTGIQIAGGSYDTVTGNLIADQGSWGVLTTDNPDPEQPPPPSHCQGGVPNDPAPGICLFEARGNRVYGNVFSHNGFFGNRTNSDLGTETLSSYTPRNCFYRNVDLGGTLTSAPAGIEGANVDGRPCGRDGTGNDAALAEQLICNTGIEPCQLPPSKARYPKQTRIVMLPVPRLASMPNPCAGVPENAFCS
ncbi:MAG: hypothetical protein LBV34_25340 [Nocardiopsaceae bacterium]|nr:hypothetical protein [Nocardiopsaceae bacterium]